MGIPQRCAAVDVCQPPRDDSFTASMPGPSSTIHYDDRAYLSASKAKRLAETRQSTIPCHILHVR